MSKPHVKPVPVFYTRPDGQIVRAPRCGDDGHGPLKPGWHVTTDAEHKAAAAKEAARKVPAPSITTTKPGPAPVKE